MGRQFELAKHYSLLQAFDQLGEHLYGTEWSGTEAWSRPVNDPDQIRRERRAINERLTDIDEQIILLSRRIARTDEEQEREALNAQRTKLTIEANELNEKKSALPDLSDSSVRDHNAFVRRCKTQETLIAGLSEESIQAQFGRGTLIDWKTWSRSDGFKLYISLSMAVVPDTLSSSRRAPVFLAKHTFGKWLNSVAPIVEKLVAELSPQQCCEAFIKEVVKQGHLRKKEDCLNDARENIPGLSERAFDRAWSNVAPVHWKKPGRRTG